MNVKLEKIEQNVTAHALPCTIHKNGEANIQKYFGGVTRKQDNKEKNQDQDQETNNAVDYKANFRGRPLNGKTIDLEKHSLSGCILNISQDNKSINRISKFSELNNWTLDSNPLTEKEINNSLFFVSTIAPIIQEKIK